MRMPRFSAPGCTATHGLAHDLRHVHRAQVQAQLARDDARNVEQILDELRLRERIALDDGHRLGRPPCRPVPPAPSSRAQPRMALSGVRSSWETTAINSSFARLADPRRSHARPALRASRRPRSVIRGALADGDGHACSPRARACPRCRRRVFRARTARARHAISPPTSNG